MYIPFELNRQIYTLKRCIEDVTHAKLFLDEALIMAGPDETEKSFIESINLNTSNIIPNLQSLKDNIECHVHNLLYITNPTKQLEIDDKVGAIKPRFKKSIANRFNGNYNTGSENYLRLIIDRTNKTMFTTVQDDDITQLTKDTLLNQD